MSSRKIGKCFRTFVENGTKMHIFHAHFETSQNSLSLPYMKSVINQKYHDVYTLERHILPYRIAMGTIREEDWTDRLGFAHQVTTYCRYLSVGSSDMRCWK